MTRDPWLTSYDYCLSSAHLTRFLTGIVVIIQVCVRLQKTWKEVVREDCQARKLNKEDAMDRCKWRKVIKEAR